MARVMIVDDAEFMRMAIRDTLFRHGHEVVAERLMGRKQLKNIWS